MKQFFVLATAFLLTAQGVWAQAEYLVKEKAKQQRDINNQQQGIAPAPQAAAASAPAATSAAAQGPSAAQQALIDRVQNDLISVKPGAPVTLQLQQSLQADLAALAKGANQPSKAALTKLTADLSAAFADKTATPKDLGQLARDINIVENCSVLTPARALTYVTATQTLLKSCGVSESNVDAIGKDLTGIVMEIQKGKPKLYQ